MIKSLLPTRLPDQAKVKDTLKRIVMIVFRI